MNIDIIFLTVVPIALAVLLYLVTSYPKTPSYIKQLGRREYAVVCAIGEVLLPAGGPVSLSAQEADVPQYVDSYVGNFPRRMRILLSVLLMLMEYGTFIFGPHFRRLSRLDVNKREKYLEGWEFSRFYFRRAAFVSMRSMFGIAYLANPEVQRYMGYYRVAERFAVENKNDKR